MNVVLALSLYDPPEAGRTTLEIRSAVAVEQARFVHRSFLTGLFGSVFVALCVALVFRANVSGTALVAWLAAFAAQAVVRTALWRRQRPDRFTPLLARAWMRQAVAGVAFSGLLWGAGAVLLLPAAPLELQLILLFALVALTVVGVISNSASRAGFLAFALGANVPAVLALATRESARGASELWLATGLSIFVVVMAMVSRFVNRSFIESLALRFENLALIDELTLQRQAADSANLAKSRFLAAASHDLRQPMHALSLYLGSLAGPDLPPRAAALVPRLRECAAMMDAMFRALLDISRLDAGAVPVQRSVFPVAELLARVKTEFEPLAKERGLELHVAACSAWIESDAHLTQRIVDNLVANAIKFTSQGRVLVGCRRRPGVLRLVVVDTGPGIAADQHAAIFQEFYQVGREHGHRERERPEGAGLGLGLATVQRLARLLGAPVTLVSSPGRGSMFAIDLPRSISAPAAAPTPVRDAGEALALAERTIVVIDDDAPVLEATCLLLERWGARVVGAASAAQALQALADAPAAPDAIVCDQRLGQGATGLAAVRALREEFNHDIPALIVTGETGPERLREVDASGLLVLHKPLPETELRSGLARLLAARAGVQAEPVSGQDGLGPVGHAELAKDR